MYGTSFSFRLLRLLLAVIVPVMGLMAQRHHAHLETVHHEHASHSHLHEHPHEHSDEPHSHDHQPVDLFLQMTATALMRSSNAPEITDQPAYCDTFLANILTDTSPDADWRLHPFPAAPHESAVREKLLRRAANLPPPALT
jgi:hypothetical protein